MASLPHSAPTSSPLLQRIEWPTWAVWFGILAAWSALVWWHTQIPLWISTPLLVLVLTWYMSLQHECLHGHPTRSARVNRLLALAPLAVWYPYDLYQSSHLQHHQDQHLTLPGLDTESNYVRPDQALGQHPAWQWLRASQRTALGRITLGPALVIVGLVLDVTRAWRQRDSLLLKAWTTHLLLLALLCIGMARLGVSIAWYGLAVAYPALGLAMLRSLYEHRPQAEPAHRIVINEAGLFWRLLYLNNNFHAVHHAHPGLAWYEIPAHYLADRDGYLRRNGGFLIQGYVGLIRRFAWRPVDSHILHAVR